MNKVTAKAVRYYGYLEGWKVYVDGKKYPRERCSWYTYMLPVDAIRRALADDLLAQPNGSTEGG